MRPKHAEPGCSIHGICVAYAKRFPSIHSQYCGSIQSISAGCFGWMSTFPAKAHI
jgi:hypothetical protein